MTHTGMSDGRLLVLGDYPIGYGNGIGETLANLLADHRDGSLYQMHPDHLEAMAGEARGQAIRFVSPRRPSFWPAAAAGLYQPLLKVRQRVAQAALFERASALIREQRIDAVLTYPVTPWVLFAAVRLRRRFPGVRFVFYVMDDWEGHHTCFGLPFTRKRRAALSEMIDTADARFAISHRMQEDYEKRFGNRWQVLHKGIDPMQLPDSARPSRLNHILYAGGMNMFRFDAVLAFAEGLRRYRAESNEDVTLTLLGSPPDGDYAPALAAFPFIRMEPWVDNAECRRRMAEADLLYLPLSFSHKLDRIANLATPTKFSEYLAAGRPVIFHVPAQSEVQHLATTARLGLTLNSVNPEDVCSFLRCMTRSSVDVQEWMARARQLLRAEFDQVVLRQRLKNALFGR